MKRNIFIFIISICILLISACFNPWREPDLGTFTIQIGDGFEGRANLPWNDNIAISDLVHTITLSGHGSTQSRDNVKTGATIQFTVIPGTWKISVEAFLEEANGGRTLMAEGSDTVEINPGQNEPVRIKMRQPNGSGNGIPGDYPLIINILAGARALSNMTINIEFSVSVSGFKNNADAENVDLDITTLSGLDIKVSAYNAWDNEKTFKIEIDFFQNSFLTDKLYLNINLNNIPEGYKLVETKTKTIYWGDGSSQFPIPVTQDNIEEFIEFANDDGRNSYFRLVENIELKPDPFGNWTTIGTSNLQFLGSFDGDNFTISGLTINKPGEDYQGMFGVIGPSAIIKNIGLVGGSVTGRDSTGGIVGHNINGTIQNSFSENTVSGNMNVGGLVGSNANSGTPSGGIVQNSFSTGDVNGNENVGGIVGSNNESTVENSYSTSKVTGTDNIGGIVGSIEQGSVRKTFSTGIISGQNNVGGIVGSIALGRVENSYSTGEVTGTDKIGGIVGFAFGTVQNTFATGAISGSDNVGGIVGRDNGSDVRNNVALNTSVTATAPSGAIHRVVGYNSGSNLNYNYGWDGIPFTQAGINNEDGEHVDSAQAISPGWWQTSGNWLTPAGSVFAWQFGQNDPWYPPSGTYLPRLRGMPGNFVQRPEIKNP
jgi:hypothetical protein